MKRFIFFLCSFFSIIFVEDLSAQTFENSYLSINLPSGWSVEKQDIKSLGLEVVVFTNDDGDVYNIGTVMGMDRYLDAKEILTTDRITTMCNAIFQNFSMEDVKHSTFIDREAYMANFSAKLDGADFRGAIYAFEQYGSSIVVIGAYKVGVKSSLPVIWKSIVWKDTSDKTKDYASFRDEVTDFVATLNNSLAQQPASSSTSERVTSVRLEPETDCFVMHVQLPGFENISLDGDQLAKMQDAVKPTLLSNMTMMGKSFPIFQRMMDNRYIFKYEITDMTDRPLFSVKIVPEDYGK